MITDVAARTAIVVVALDTDATAWLVSEQCTKPTRTRGFGLSVFNIDETIYR
jgi:hypothetical protein